MSTRKKSRGPLPKAINSWQEIGWHILALPWSYGSLLLDLARVLKYPVSANSQKELVISTSILSKLQNGTALRYPSISKCLWHSPEEKSQIMRQCRKGRIQVIPDCEISASSWWSKGSFKGHSMYMVLLVFTAPNWPLLPLVTESLFSFREFSIPIAGTRLRLSLKTAARITKKEVNSSG